jgi:hypothetical protein
MPKIAYIEKQLRPLTWITIRPGGIDEKFPWYANDIIRQANDIIDEYIREGFDLTLRQLFYQFVSRDVFPNCQELYNKLGDTINDARLLGMIDWDVIVDRTRYVRSLAHWDNPGQIIAAAASQYRVDRWANQFRICEVWIEKDALIGVIEGVCRAYDVSFVSCRGYISQSEMWRAAQRMGDYNRNGKRPVVLHLGDHDPSGIDMTRDIQDRFRLFRVGVDVKRIALTGEQIGLYNPPPNPIKLLDSRSGDYATRYGNESWELDALEPRVIHDLIENEIRDLIDEESWDESQALQDRGRDQLRTIASHYEE